MVRGRLKQCGLAWPPLPSHQFPPLAPFPFHPAPGLDGSSKGCWDSDLIRVIILDALDPRLGSRLHSLTLVLFRSS